MPLPALSPVTWDAMNETVFSRHGWIPNVVRDDDGLKIELGAGADALHQPRTFSFPISEAHLEVIRNDLTRHILLWAAVLPLCDAAGIGRPLDEEAAVALLDPILFGSRDDVESFMREIPGYKAMLVGYGADIQLLERGQIFDSMHSATEESDAGRVKKYVADSRRAQRGVRLTPLDAAVLKYTGHYFHGAKIPTREPDAVDPALLPDVMQVIATAEQACAGMGSSGEKQGREDSSATRKREWKQIEKAVHRSVRRAYPRLADDAVRSVTFLMCSEARERNRRPDLSEAIVLFLRRFPGKNEEEFRSRVDTAALRDAVRSILDETMRIHIDWGDKTLAEIGGEVRTVVRERHPELSDAAIHKLGNYFTYLVK